MCRMFSACAYSVRTESSKTVSEWGRARSARAADRELRDVVFSVDLEDGPDEIATALVPR